MICAAGSGCAPFFSPLAPRRHHRLPQPTVEPIEPPAEPATNEDLSPNEDSVAPTTESAAPVHVTAPAPVPKPTVTLSGGNASRQHAEKLLNEVDSRLTKIDRAKLAGPDLAVYNQANGFVVSARRALEDQDYVVASSLAQKASTLTGRLPNGSSP